MHRPLLLATSVLLGFASIAVAFASSTLTSGRVTHVSTEPSAAVAVTRYYEAVNQMIATGDAALLRDVVHPDLIDTESPAAGAWGGLAGIEHYLTYLHGAAPKVRLDADVTVDEAADVTALIRVRTSSPTPMIGFWLDDRSVLWPEVEQFRVEEGWIVERRASWDGMAVIEPVATNAFLVDIGQKRMVTVGLDTYSPGARGYYVPLYAPDMLLALSGELAIQQAESPDQAGFVLEIDDSGNNVAVFAPGSIEGVAPGDIKTLPAGSGYSVGNEHSVPATVLVVSMPFVPPPSEVYEHYATSSMPGVIGQSLARFELRDGESRANVAIGQVSLMPGGRLSVDPLTRLMVICAVSDTFRCTTFEPHSGRVGDVRIDPHVNKAFANGSSIVLVRDGGGGVLVNGGSEPASVWVLAVTVDTIHAG